MYTCQKFECAEHDIEQDIQTIISAVQNNGVAFDAIYLVGSFGRGEGSVHFDGVRWRGVNDYDVLLICSEFRAGLAKLRELGQRLAEMLRIDFVDIGYLPRAALKNLPLTIEVYDLKYASRLVVGEDVLGELPEFDSHEIPAYEFARLICNRTAGLLTALLPYRIESLAYHRNQHVKACIAVGDVAVYLRSGYYPSYLKRMELFRSLVEQRNLGFPLDQACIDQVLYAYASKVGGDLVGDFPINASLMPIMIERAFCAITSRCVDSSVNSVAAAEMALIRYYLCQQSLIQRVNEIFSAWCNRDQRANSEIKNRILFSLPSFYCSSARAQGRLALNFARTFWFVPGALRKRWTSASAALIWEEYCH
jgi:hypothetical protein